LRREINEELERETYAYYQQLAAQGMAGQKLMSLHYEHEARSGSAAGDRASALRRQSRR
jgi:hypothetical protein